MAVVINPHIIAPKKPTLRRYLSFNRSRRTLFRKLTNETIKNEVLHGKILDIGGGERASYRSFLKIDGTYESVNISADIGATYVANIEKELPLESNSFDTVFSLNTFEHIYNIDFALSEATRVLKPSGKAIFQIPFLYRVHGSPNDFHRQTHSWWVTKMTELGFDSNSITIEPLMWDVHSVGFSITERHKFFLPFYLRRAISLLPGLIHSMFKFRSSSKAIPPEALLLWQDYALGYVIRANKLAA